MATKQKRVQEAKKRDKRSKIALGALGVVLLAVGAYEIPSMLSVMNKKPPPGTTYDPGPSSVPPGSGLPNVATGPTTPGPTAAPSGQLVDTDVPPSSGAGQLVTFEVFVTKNPFVPQVSSAPAAPVTSTTPTTTKPTSTTPTTTPTSTTPNSAVPSSGGSTTTPATTTPAPPPAPTVTISVNGVTMRVATTGTFPTDAPVFRLVSYQTGSAQIGIVGGSYAAGGATLTLQVGHPVTLQNTTDGHQYKLELLKTP